MTLLIFVILAMYDLRVFWYVALITWAVAYLRAYPVAASRRRGRRG